MEPGVPVLGQYVPTYCVLVRRLWSNTVKDSGARGQPQLQRQRSTFRVLESVASNEAELEREFISLLLHLLVYFEQKS